MDTKADTELTQYLAKHPDKRMCSICGEILHYTDFEAPGSLEPICDVCADAEEFEYEE